MKEIAERARVMQTQQGQGEILLSRAESSPVRRMPVRTCKIKLDGDFVGFELVMRLNPKLRVIKDMASGDMDALTAALGEVILQWNFPDEQGEPMPPPSQETIEELPIDLITLIAERYQQEINKLPPA